MNANRFFNDAVAGDTPLTTAPPPPLETPCEIERHGCDPIRLQPSSTHAGTSTETDRIINRWRPRISDLVEQSISMARDLCEISWNGIDEPYPCCPFLKLITPEGHDMRRFTDEACHLMLQVSTGEEILEAYWYNGRSPDARDLREWMERWALWLPGQDGQFRLWSIFLPCDAIEALYRYVHALVHDYYLAILEMHVLWEENQASNDISAIPMLPRTWEGQKEFLWIPPRLLVEGGEIWLNQENAQELREWGMIAFGAWKFSLSDRQREDLYDLVLKADSLCQDSRFSD